MGGRRLSITYPQNLLLQKKLVAFGTYNLSVRHQASMSCLEHQSWSQSAWLLSNSRTNADCYLRCCIMQTLNKWSLLLLSILSHGWRIVSEPYCIERKEAAYMYVFSAMPRNKNSTLKKPRYTNMFPAHRHNCFVGYVMTNNTSIVLWSNTSFPTTRDMTVPSFKKMNY